jgi:hypothetical protein
MTKVMRTATAAACVTKPIRLNLISPRDARATPIDIIKTITVNFLLGSWILKAHEIRRIATGVNAYSLIRTKIVRRVQ